MTRVLAPGGNMGHFLFRVQNRSSSFRAFPEKTGSGSAVETAAPDGNRNRWPSASSIDDFHEGLLVKMLCLCRGRSGTGFRRGIPIAIARQGQAFQVVKRTLTRYRDRNLLPAMGA